MKSIQKGQCNHMRVVLPAISVNEGRARGGNAAKNAYTMGIIKALITSMKNEFEH